LSHFGREKPKRFLSVTTDSNTKVLFAVTVQVVERAITPQLAPSERVQGAETEPFHHGEPLHHHPVALAVIQQKFERRARTVAKDVDGALQGIVAEALATHGPEAIDAFAEIDGLRGHKDAALRG
jgi:hypothetical protein